MRGKMREGEMDDDRGMVNEVESVQKLCRRGIDGSGGSGGSGVFMSGGGRFTFQ